MPISPYWRTVWEVALFLLAISMLNWLAAMVLGMIGVSHMAAISDSVLGLITIVGALTYLNWRWGWQADTIGLTNWKHLRWLPAGLGMGVAGLGLTAGLGLLFGHPLSLAMSMTTTGLLAIIPAFIHALGVELIFRGGATARLQADLAPKEALGTALALPAVATFLGSLFTVPSGVAFNQPWTIFFAAVLTLLYFRTGSIWLSLGLHALVVWLPIFLGLSISAPAALLLWAVVGAILFWLEWKRIDRMPRRVPPQRFRSYRR